MAYECDTAIAGCVKIVCILEGYKCPQQYSGLSVVRITVLTSSIIFLQCIIYCVTSGLAPMQAVYICVLGLFASLSYFL